MNTRNLFFTALLIVTLALAGGLVMAQDDDGGSDEDNSAKQHHGFGRRGGFHPGRGFHGFGGRGMAMPRGFGMPGAQGLQDLVMEATGLEAAALHEALRDGDSLASLIEANGGDVDAFIAEATSVVTENASARIAERIEAMVRGDFSTGMRDAGKGRMIGPRAFGGRGAPEMHGLFMPGARGDMGGMVLEATGLEIGDLHSALREGDSLAGLIEANGGDVDAFIAGLSEAFSARVDAAVEAGRLGEERASAYREGITERLEALVHGEFPAREKGRDWRGWSHGDKDSDDSMDDDATETSNT